LDMKVNIYFISIHKYNYCLDLKIDDTAITKKVLNRTLTSYLHFNIKPKFTPQVIKYITRFFDLIQTLTTYFIYCK